MTTAGRLLATRSSLYPIVGPISRGISLGRVAASRRSSAPNPRARYQGYRNHHHLVDYLSIPPTTTTTTMASDTSSAAPRVLTAPPELDFRWVHTGSKLLDLPIVPIPANETQPYKPFSADENARIEASWNAMPDDKRARIVAHWGLEDGEWGQRLTPAPKKKDGKGKGDSKAATKGKAKAEAAPAGPDTPVLVSDAEALDADAVDKKQQYRSIIEQAQRDPSRLDTVAGVPVAQDSLFEVDLDTLSLHPVFWPQSGPRVPVMRGTWYMGAETRPCTWDLAREIENGYQATKPWLDEYQHKQAAAAILGPSAEETLKYPLPARFGQGLAVIYETENRCRLVASGAFDYLSRYVYSSFGSKPSGTYVYRGYAAAQAGSKEAKASTKSVETATPEDKQDVGDAVEVTAETGTKTPSTGASTTPKDDKKKGKLEGELLPEILLRVKKEFDLKKRALEEANAPVTHTRFDDVPCTDLILVIHGIGQNLATQYESFNFVYNSNQLRQNMRKQSMDPALASIMRDRRAQILPVQWRANLYLDTESENEHAEFEHDNIFTISDVTIGKSIPYVREVTNSVLLDIPLFMSDEKKHMTRAVCQQANKLYRLWIARNLDFEKRGGRVHIIGHSLGSALAAEILSNQPTIVPASADMPRQVVEDAKDRFVFNTHNCYLAGSPLAIFLKLRHGHLLARSGRPRTMRSPRDEAHQHPGKFGCMAVDSLYNVFYTTDPVAYALNPTVDVAVAKTRPPLDIPSVAKSNFPALPPLPALPQMPDLAQYLPSYFGGSGGKDKPPKDAGAGADADTDAGIELTGEPAQLAGTRGERRFAALNPRGSIDFSLPTSAVNDYLDMVTAHGNYWTDANFAAFILAETFASPADQARTRVGVEKGNGKGQVAKA